MASGLQLRSAQWESQSGFAHAVTKRVRRVALRHMKDRTYTMTNWRETSAKPVWTARRTQWARSAMPAIPATTETTINDEGDYPLSHDWCRNGHRDGTSDPLGVLVRHDQQPLTFFWFCTLLALGAFLHYSIGLCL